MENRDENNDKYRDFRIEDIVICFNYEILRVQEDADLPEELKKIYVSKLKNRMQQILDSMK
ncbi:MAG: hypothetical protein WCD53_09095 [Microcoleus sp.]